MNSIFLHGRKIFSLAMNKVLVSALIAQLTSQLFKVFYPLLKKQKPDLTKINAYGGFPSAHTAFISGATFSLGFSTGFNSPIFGFAVVVSIIIISDIIVIRSKLYENILITYEIAKKLNIEKKENENFKNHTPFDVIFGILYGFFISFIVHILWK